MVFSWIIFLVIVLVAVTFLVKSAVTYKVDTKSAEAVLFQEEVLYTSPGIIYQDPVTQRPYPGIIDIALFTETRLGNAVRYQSENTQLAARLTLIGMDGAEIRSIIYNKEWYNRWKPLDKPNLVGSGAVTSYTMVRYVLVQDSATRYPANLSIEVIFPNK